VNAGIRRAGLLAPLIKPKRRESEPSSLTENSKLDGREEEEEEEEFFNHYYKNDLERHAHTGMPPDIFRCKGAPI